MPENETIVEVGIVPAKDGLIKIVLSESKSSSLLGAKAASGAKYDVKDVRWSNSGGRLVRCRTGARRGVWLLILAALLPVACAPSVHTSGSGKPGSGKTGSGEVDSPPPAPSIRGGSAGEMPSPEMSAVWELPLQRNFASQLDEWNHTLQTMMWLHRPPALRIMPRCHRHELSRASQQLELQYELCPVLSDSAPPPLPAVLLRLRLLEAVQVLLPLLTHTGTPAVVEAFACFDASSSKVLGRQAQERPTEMTMETLVTDHLLQGSDWFNYSPFYAGPQVLRITGVHSSALSAMQRVQLATETHRLRSLQPDKQQYSPPCDICRNTTIMSAAEQRHSGSATRAIVTFVSTPSYLVSARVLLHSLRSAGSRVPVLVAVLEPSTPALKALYDEVRRMIDRDFGPHDVSIVTWGVIEPPADSHEHPRWTLNYAKLHLFGMRQFDEILYVDSDAIALRNADDLFSHPIVRKSTARYLAVADWGAYTRPPMDAKANGGVLFVRPSTSLLSCMLSTLRKAKATDFKSAEAEQGFLRFIFGDSAAMLPITFNMQKSNKKHNPSVFSLDRTTFLHFTGTKPHATWSRSAFLARFRPSDLRTRLAAVDQIDDEDPAYDELTALWRRSYFRLAQLGRFLNLFVAYHNGASWARIWPDLGAWHPSDALVPLSLTPNPVDPNGLTIQNELPSLSDPAKQLQLGESAALLAIAKSKYDKPWVGFATYNEQGKALWQEGVSLDWVKVEEAILASQEDGALGTKNKTVLFWYGIFAGDYWRLLDMHHAGMRPVLLQTLRDMNQQPSRRRLAPIDVSLIDRKMPPDRFWPFGNFVIMPAPLLREYAMFLEAFVEAFVARYSATCPFSTMQPDRCLGYVTERLIHVWAVTSGVELVYAVDDPKVRYLATCEISDHQRRVRQLLRGPSASPSPLPLSASTSPAAAAAAAHDPSFQLLSTSGVCRTDDQNKGNFDEDWGMSYTACHDKALYATYFTGFEYAVEGKKSRCKLFKGPILSTLPVGGARCYKKASKTELGPHKKRL